ncbi:MULTISPECIES: hypothetical protein [Paenibacillus]|uniref:Uncharacterized protein n=1 Tax=Paenibacillus violae TaxID=3077234 RepID=A0ABU3R8G8_9BACL|nr:MULTISPECIES: hypothetical protein [Paenibacillus]MDU0200561.1 hypothetical protein [Paenibacillus sp. PFR10]MEC0265573.1 hypothetical protein [Paenibacillus anseongense]
MQKGVEINGSIFADEGDLGHNEFLDAFIEFIESKGWQFGGGTKQVNEFFVAT